MAKRIIGGKTYNTETATCLATVNYRQEDEGQFDELYQTRLGVYFRYHGDKRYADHNGMIEEIQPLSPHETQEWIEKNSSAELLEKHFGVQPEAGETESRITLRIPDALKNQIEGLASDQKQSLNSWIMRCMENCVLYQIGPSLKPLLRRGHNFSGPNADRDRSIYTLYRQGSQLEILAQLCGLSLDQAEQIIMEANGGKMPTVFLQ